MTTQAQTLEQRCSEVGAALGRRLGDVLAALPQGADGPQELARALGLDKVLTSRLKKALRGSRDPMAVLASAPGPEPLRRFLRAAKRRGAGPGIVRRAEEAVADFEQLIRRDVGDRSSLDVLISSWLPEARAEFELRRKQAAYKAISQLKGVSVETNLSTVLLHPSEDGEHIDIVWLIGLLGLVRLRPGARARFATRRIAAAQAPRHPEALEESGSGLADLGLEAFCTRPVAPIEATRAGEVVHYVLGGDAYGPGSAVDLLMGEVNLAEIPRFVPQRLGRKGYVFAEVSTPSESMLFDVLVHEDVYPGSDPELRIYDTAFDGVADCNDPARDMDRMDLAERLVPLGRRVSSFRAPELPRYLELLQHVLGRMGWDGDRLRGYRCRIDYPLYGTQVAAVFDPPEPPADR